MTDKAKLDLILVEKARDHGDPRAYSALMAKYRDPIFFMLYEKLNDKELAKELTISALGKAFSKIHLYTPTFAFSTWLFTIARNNSIDYLRKKKLTTVSLDALIEYQDGGLGGMDFPSDGPSPESIMMKKQRIQILKELVDKLKPQYRDLVKLRYFKEYTYDEIAQEMDIPIGTVKAQLHRCREKLFKLLAGSKESF
jgi:RNA polymerase sigma factor (sigma-70 family)